MLPEERRKQLDGIVQQMVSNKENENTINFVVNDFKSKYSVKAPEKSFLEKTSDVLDMIFGGQGVGQAIGTQKVKSDVLSGKVGVGEVDYSKLSERAKQKLTSQGVPTTAEEQRKQTSKQIESPTGLQVAGSALQSAALFLPVGTVGKFGATLLAKAGLKNVASKVAGNIGAGALTGEIFDISSNLQQGKTGKEALTPGFGTLIGGGLPTAGYATKFMVRFPEKQAPRIINSLIKPLAKDFSYGKNPGRAVAEEGIVANNFEDLLNGIRESRQKIGREIGTLGDTLSTQPLLNIESSLNPLDEAIKTAASQNNTSLLQRLNNVKRAITDVLEPVVNENGDLAIRSVGSKNLSNLTFKEARTVLSDIGDMTSFTGNPTDDKLVNSALKQVYGNIKNESLKMARNVNPEVAARFEKLTEKYGDLISAEVATKYRDKILQRQNLVGLTPTTVGIGSALITAVATGGATIPTILIGLSGATIDKLASTPAFKTRLAYLLSSRSRSEANFLFRKIPALRKIFNLEKGATPGDVLLNKSQEVIEKSKTLPNKTGGFIKAGESAESSLLQEAKKYKTAEEFVKAKTKRPDYGYGHSPNEEGVRAFDLTEKVDGEQMIPKDMYQQWYGSRGTAEDLESISVLKKIKGNPEAYVTIYRASPKEGFNYGDWITLSKKYAQQHAEGNNFKVFSQKAKAKDIRWAMDDINEFGYFPESTKSKLEQIWKKANKK